MYLNYCHLVVKKDEDTERREAGGGEGVEGLEEEDELEVEGDGLEVGAQGRDRDELGDVEQEREHDHRRHVAVHRLLVGRVTLLKSEKCLYIWIVECRFSFFQPVPVRYEFGKVNFLSFARSPGCLQ